MAIPYIKAACRRLSCDSNSIEDDRPETPLWGTSRPSSYSYWDAPPRQPARPIAQSPLAPARPESSVLPLTETRPGLKPLRLPELVRARELAAAEARLSSVPMQCSPPPSYPPANDWAVRHPLPVPEQVRLPSPVPLLRGAAPGDVLFDFETEAEAEAIGQSDDAYDGCAIELTLMRPGRQRTQYDVRNTRYGQAEPFAATAPLNIVKKTAPVQGGRPMLRATQSDDPGPPPNMPLPPVPAMPPLPPPRASSLPYPRPNAVSPYLVAHNQVMAAMRARGHPLPELLRQIERGHPLMLCPSYTSRATPSPEPLGRPGLNPATPWPLGGLPR